MKLLFKICRKCDKEKSLNQFYGDSSSKDGKSSNCKECYKKRYEEKKEVIIAKNRIYQKNNQEKFREYNINYNRKYYRENKGYFSNYYLNNKEKINEQLRISQNKRYNSDLNYKIKSNLRVRFWHALKKGIKSKSVIILLGCSIEELKNYLEKQFKEGMSWKNHGKIWEIDHIIPCSSFDLLIFEEQVKCFHYSNLQPLFKTINRKKSNKIYGDL